MLHRDDIARRIGTISPRLALRTTYVFLNVAERRQVLIVLLSSLMNSLLGLTGILGVVPFFRLLIEPDPLAPNSVTGSILRRVGIVSESQAIIVVGLIVVSLIVLKNAYGVIHLRLVNRLCARIEARAATAILRYIIDAPFGWYLHQNAAVLRDVVLSDVLEWSRSLVRPVLNLVNDLFLMLLAVITLVAVTPAAGLVVTIVGAMLAAGLLAISSPRVMLATRRKRHSYVVASIAATEAVNGGRDVRMSRAGEVLLDEFHRSYSVYAYSDADSRQWQQIPRNGIEIVGLSALVSIAIGAILLGMDRLETATILAVYALVAVRLIPLLGEISRNVSTVRETMHRSHYLMVMLQRVVSATTSPPPVDTPAVWKRLSFERVDYRYENAEAFALQHINLSLENGQSYGLVGSSGAGKSTFADLAAGLIEPTHGQVLLDGVPISAEMRAGWRRRVAYVSQHPIIFDTRLADNIVLGDQSDDSIERLNAAISKAGLDSVVANLPQGHDTILGDRGTRLSGGQRQRVAIARALYQRADLLILDEATSALDGVTEAEVTEAISALKGKITLIVIAHRMSTVINCDKILVMKNGSLIGEGTHAELLKSSDEYAKFANAQNFVS